LATTVAQLVNQALRRIGYQVEVAYLFEGSQAARAALTLYGQTRDNLLRSKDWPFARQSVALTLLKTAPVGGYGFQNPWTSAYPPVPWIYEYAYPAGCLEMRSVRPTPLLIPEYDPVPNIFVIADDTALAPPAKVVLTNLRAALAVFTGQVTDMTQWEPMFTEALVEALARRFAEALAGENADALKLQLGIEQATEGAADLVRG
jgi:hypothetical protein